MNDRIVFPAELQEAERRVLVIFGMLALGLVALAEPLRPAWLKDLPPIGGRRAGAWRGKGSFGKAPFGKQGGHGR